MDIKSKIAVVLLLISYGYLLFNMDWLLGHRKEIISNIVELKDDKGMINADNLISQIKEVLKSNPKEIKIKVNSNGGRIVQGERIYNYISKLDIPVYSYVENQCLSACYYAISSSDKIYSNKTSVVGNIGVINPEPKPPFEIFTWSGKYKNPKPNKEYIRKHLTRSDKIMHKQIIIDIQKYRTNLKGTRDQLFEGLFWVGIEAREMGLVDDFRSLD